MKFEMSLMLNLTDLSLISTLAECQFTYVVKNRECFNVNLASTVTAFDLMIVFEQVYFLLTFNQFFILII